MESPTNSHSDYDISPRPRASRIFCLTMSMAVHIVFESIDWSFGDDAAGRKRRGKPRLRRSFALPAPGLPSPFSISNPEDRVLFSVRTFMCLVRAHRHNIISEG
jgi:hypothetical protein